MGIDSLISVARIGDRFDQRLTGCAIFLLVVVGCSTPVSDKSPAESSATTITSQQDGTPRNESRAVSHHRVAYPRFRAVAAETGLNFSYINGAKGQVLMVEAMGGGVGWIDFDGDGLLDLYFCQGGNPVAESNEVQPSDQLFRQMEPGRFQPVTSSAAISEWRYSQGVSVADYDDDGFDDVFVANVGPDTLLRNCGDGTFLDVSVVSGVNNPYWGTSSAWSDLDGDGDLDFYVCNYVEYDPLHSPPCIDKFTGKVGTCTPQSMKSVPGACYINQGDGTFTEEEEPRGLRVPHKKALGVVIADLSNDGLPDIYVANDTTPNFLFINQGAGHFAESAKHLGCAVNREGLPQASMGIAIGDYDRNGWLDLCCTNFTRESATLYRNLGESGFKDVTLLVGLRQPTIKSLGFGTLMEDFNQDGYDDLFFANGHVDETAPQKNESYEMEAQLFSFDGSRFLECSREAGSYFSEKHVGRAVAQGDYDNDGDWDLIVVHHNEPAVLLRNDSSRGHWLKIRFQCPSNRRGIGTRVMLSQGKQQLIKELAGGVSYCAAQESSLIFGLGEDSRPCELQIRWPDGTMQTVKDVAVDQSLILKQSRNQ